MTLQVGSPSIDGLPAGPAPARWTKEQFYATAVVGGFRGRRVFLHRGELIEMPPMGWLHAAALTRATRLFVERFPQCAVRVQMSFDGADDYCPEPDLAMITQQEAQKRSHPRSALLVMEVSDSSLDFDHEKAVIYAAAKVPEYWILNVVNRQLEVYRDIVADPTSQTGFRYTPPVIYGESDTATTLIDPTVQIAVASLLP